MMSNSSSNSEALPRVLIVGEAPISENAGGAGQTIYNLFKHYPADKIFSVSSDYNKKSYNQDSIIKNVIFFKTTFVPPLKNRIGLIINQLIGRINYKIRKWWPLDEIQKIKKFQPEIILLVPNLDFHLLFGLRLTKALGKPFMVYYMDDWMVEKEKDPQYGVVLKELVYQSLYESSGWMMISKELNRILADRYSIPHKASIVVQNPVNIQASDIKSIPRAKEDNFKIFYAGSIWPMHYDALIIFAKAVKQLKEEGVKVQLIIFTFSYFWDKYKEEFEGLEIKYGGELKYSQVIAKLKEGDLHLVTSSFENEWAPHAQASVQTKITDYMASSKPVISYGPEYSACHRFVKEWEVGYVSSKKNFKDLAQDLKSIIQNKEANGIMGERNLETIKNHFSSEVICPKLYDFISQISVASKNK